jgi:hypothetical protein
MRFVIHIYQYFGLLVFMCIAVSIISCNNRAKYQLECTTYWDVVDVVRGSSRLSYVDVSNKELLITDSKKNIQIVNLVTKQSQYIQIPKNGSDKYLLEYPRYLKINDILYISSVDQLLAMSMDGSVMDVYNCLTENDIGYITDLKWDTKNNNILVVLLLEAGDLKVLNVNWNPHNGGRFIIADEKQFSYANLNDHLKKYISTEFCDQDTFFAGWLGRAYIDDKNTYFLFAVTVKEKFTIGMLQTEQVRDPIIICADIDAFGYWANRDTENGSLSSEILSSTFKDSRLIRSYTQFLGALNSEIMLPSYESHTPCIALFRRDNDGNWVRSKSTKISTLNVARVRDALLSLED